MSALHQRTYRRTHLKECLEGVRDSYARRISAFSTIKLERGCFDCGYNADPAALDFDHVAGEKIGQVSKLSLVQGLDEIEKCVVRCANCHRIRTEQQRFGRVK